MLGLLVCQRLRLFWNRLSKGPRGGRRLIGALVGVVFTVAFVAFAGLNAGQLVLRVARTEPQAASQTLPVLLIGVSLLTLVTSLSSAFHHLFLAGDLELLLSAPVPSRSLFWLKVLEVWRDSLHVLLFQGAALFGYGQSLGLPWTYYPLAFVCGIVLTIGASALGTLLTLGLARVRFGEPVLGLSRLLAVVLFLPVGALGVPALGFGRGRTSLLVGQDTIQAAASGLRDLGPPPPWAPTTWAAHVLVGDDTAVLSAGLLAATALLIFVLAELTYGALFQSAWERVRFSGGAARGHASHHYRAARWGAPNGPLANVLQKDLRTLVRDPRWRTGALVSLI
ncbi:MAG TPA: hypothetical protein VGQ62_13610, partial [Chloroflexota bacterium]|nr:hypothetical protein [Chloroflexota bacterium]